MLLWCVACSEKQASESSTKLEKDFHEESVLTVKDSVVIDDVFRMLSWKVSDGRVCFLDGNRADTLLHVYSYPTGESIRNFLTIGNGPGQFIVVNSGECNGADDMLLYDIMRRKLSIYDIADNSTAPREEYSLPVDSLGIAHPYTYITQVNDSVFLMKLDSDVKSAWQMADLKNAKILWENSNPYRDETISYTPFDFIQTVADSTILIAYRYMDLIETYGFSVDGGMSKKSSYGNPEDQSSIKDYNDLVYHNISVAKGPGNFYCLRSSNGDDWGNVVEVYDISSGKTKELCTLDKFVTSISICGNFLFGYNQEDNMTKLYIWEL